MRREQLEKAQAYIKGGVSKLLERMTYEVLKARPRDVTGFMVEWLQQHGAASYQEIRRQYRNKPQGIDSSHSDEYGEEVDEIGELPAQIHKNNQNNRNSVSAEVYAPGRHFEAKVTAKAVEVRQKMKQLLSDILLFRELEDKDMGVIVDALEQRRVARGTTVIAQGDAGNELYVVAAGSLECLIAEGGQPPRPTRQYRQGEVFGELALMYNTPRAATVVAREDCELYSLDRQTFNHIVKSAAVAAREKYEQFLGDVQVLKELSPAERSKLCDCLNIQVFAPGQRIISEGERGNAFYLIVEGVAGAYKVNPNSGMEEKVYDYHEKMYFGELALLKDEPRAASVIAESPLKVATIDRNAFKRILGPLDQIMKRNAEKYSKFK